MTSEEEEKFNELSFAAGTFFKPHTPVDTSQLFAGRLKQIRKTLDVIFQDGQHAIIFGERGVGKTSLANVFSYFMPSETTKLDLLSVRINCDATDTFTSVWKKVIDEMQMVKNVNTIGFKATSAQPTHFKSHELFPNETINPDEVRRVLQQITGDFRPVIVIDEFDRLKSDARKVFADLIKTLSDHNSRTTILLIGVGDSVEQLIKEHQSISRAMAQVPMPRMNVDEIRDIITSRLAKLGISIDQDALSQISLLAMGLPHYAHLIGLHATRDALDHGMMNIAKVNVKTAIDKSIEDIQHSIRTNYNKSIQSARKNSLFPDVLLACALSEINEVGEFTPQDVRVQMKRITKKDYEVASFAQHLNEFSDPKRGRILHRTGELRSYRYRFSDPLMQPYVIMQGLIANKLSLDSFV